MKKIVKSVLSVILAIVMSMSMMIGALAYENDDAQNKADMLYTLGLFKGTENGYELDKELTRIQALIMLIRLSGKEIDALYGDETSHPFTDCPDWEDADKYLGYAYENGLTAGVSETSFDPDAKADLRMYITFVLRSLGYTDSAWENWETLAAENGLIPEGVDAENFLRGDAVLVSHAALSAKMNGSELTLEQKLAEDGAFNELALAVAGAMSGKEITPESDIIDILGLVYAGSGSVEPGGLMPSEINAENINFFLGVDADTISFVEGIACEPMMSSTAHSVSVLRIEEDADAEAAKKAIRENIEPRKWVCVGVSEANVRVENIGNLILVVMDNIAPDALVANFRSMDKTLVTADENGMLNIDGAYIEADESYNASSVENFAAKLVDLRSKYFPENDVYYVTIPEKSYFVRNYTVEYLNHDTITGYLSENLFDWKTVDISKTLTLEDYYTTDRHWRQEKLMPTVKALGEMMGFTVNTDTESFEQHSLEGFTGDYKNAVSDIPAETLVWLSGEYTDGAVVDNFQDDKVTTVYDESKLQGKVPYDVFLSGATPLTVITNPKAAKERELVIFRDSYGSSIAPLMIEAYSKITLVDLRYMSSDLLGDYVDFTDAEVLFLMSDKIVNNSIMLK